MWRYPMKYLLMLMILASCSSFYRVQVESISSPEAAGERTFSLYSGMKDVPDDDLRFQKYATVISRGLVQKGFVPDHSQPAMKIYVSYSISSPQTYTSTRAVPKTSVVSNVWGQQVGTINSYQTVTDTDVEYTRQVVLKAYSPNQKMLWETTLVSSGYSSDLSEALPYMVAAGIDYYGTNQERTTVEVSEGDPRARNPASH
jgi:peroxiredoxin